MEYIYPFEGGSMAKNPNAVAALSAGTVIIAVEQLITKYTNIYLPPFWSKAVVVALPVIVLYVGKDGIKGAVKQAWATVKKLWTGPVA
jgi:hypothetical protein